MTYNQCSKISQSTSKLTWWVVFVRDSQAFFKKQKKQKTKQNKTKNRVHSRAYRFAPTTGHELHVSHHHR